MNVWNTCKKKVFSPGFADYLEGTAALYPHCHVGKEERHGNTQNFKTPAIKSEPHQYSGQDVPTCHMKVTAILKTKFRRYQIKATEILKSKRL
jgi:hypothetical protein